ncbi:alanine dehydrogenase [Enterococcus sp. DIV0187]|uniref:alanine dehydrogenase n=1 Tax=Enterococcus sp. DIV0187 TaxID=2774644 RepID=UPI003F26DC75
MIVGVVKEIKNNENRIGLTPDSVAEYVSAGHQVLVENNGGQGAGFPNEDYVAAGAKILDTAAEVWEQSNMIVKVKEPIQSEYKYLRDDLILYTYLHLAADKPLTEALLNAGTTAVAYETIVDPQGGLPCLAPMSEIAGRMAAMEGAKYLEGTFSGKGVLLAGVPGVKKGKVTIIGGGNVGTNAAKIAMGLGADVTILDISARRLAYLDDIFGSRIQTLYSSRSNILNSIAEADVVIGAVLIPGKKAPKLLKEADLKVMKKGTVLVDVAVDQGGCFETTKATTHQDPIFIVDDIVHYCVANMPGAVAKTSTQALVNTTLKLGLDIANKGLSQALEDNKGLVPGVNCYQGKCTFDGVAEAFGLETYSIMELI